MEQRRLERLIERASQSRHPEILFVKRIASRGRRLGVFASSFNPVTCAHLELMRRAAGQYSLDEMLALAGTRNADKTQYECPLGQRIQMLLLATREHPRLSVAISTSAFFVDMVDPVAANYPPGTEIYFITGFDTFERILDPEDRYTGRYHRKFQNRGEALRYLLARSHLIVAGRKGRGAREWEAIAKREAESLRAIPEDRIQFMDFPEELGERSSSEVRQRIRAGLSITGLVPPAAERYIQERRLYGRSDE
jgi:nicotinate (nicotinamide) nucleotide adenylyltransferase